MPRTRECPLCAGTGYVPTDIETKAHLQLNWRFVRSGLTQTALPPDVNLADYEVVQRTVGRWYGPWHNSEDA
jgi:hypothetical protein